MKDAFSELALILGDESAILTNEPLKNHTTFKIGGNADYVINLNNENVSKIGELIRYAKQQDIPYVFIGNGSNVLFSDEGFRGIVFLLRKFDDYKVYDDYVHASSGILLSKLSKVFAENSFTGLEFACGIPGTLGGGIFMNAGAYGGEMKDLVIDVDYLDIDTMEVKNLKNEELEFSYRKSIFQGKLSSALILGANLKAVKGDKDEILAKMDANTESRNQKQPVTYPSAGSTFRREEGIIVAKLIDEAGLKGYKIGGAQVSDLHAGFIINAGGATAKDILDLVAYVKKVIKEKYDVELHEEIKYIKERGV
jgi:UDP-N-acetylmuramate dehydrogenase